MKVPMSDTGTASNGNQRCAPALKKDEDDKDDQAQCFEKRVDDFAYACRYSFGRVERNGVSDARRKCGRKFLHARFHRGRGLNGIRTRQLVDRHHARGRLVIASRKTIRLIAELDASNVAQVENRPIRIGAKNNVAELFRRYKTSLRTNRVGELLTVWNRLGADLPGRIHVVLRLDRGDHFRRRHAELRKLIGLHPDAHGVLTAEGLHARHALDAGELILNVDDRVVSQEVRAQLSRRVN